MRQIDSPPPMVAAAQTESYRILPGRADLGVIVICDHANNAFPPEYGTLGLAACEIERHIAYDIGGAAVTERIARALGAPAVMSHFSRLLIDPNRGADDPTLIMRLSDGAIIPGNRHLDVIEREKRIRRYYAPYHNAIEQVIDQCLAVGVQPLIVSVHSFTPQWRGVARPWHVGILWDKDKRTARRFIDGFREDVTLAVGDNQPYKGSLEGDCLWQHATRRGLPNVLIEYRQDLVGDTAGQEEWARRTITIVDDWLARTDPET